MNRHTGILTDRETKMDEQTDRLANARMNRHKEQMTQRDNKHTTG